MINSGSTPRRGSFASVALAPAEVSRLLFASVWAVCRSRYPSSVSFSENCLARLRSELIRGTRGETLFKLKSKRVKTAQSKKRWIEQSDSHRGSMIMKNNCWRSTIGHTYFDYFLCPAVAVFPVATLTRISSTFVETTCKERFAQSLSINIYIYISRHLLDTRVSH